MNTVVAAKKIENYYICYRNKQLFKLLKTALCAAELSLTEDLIKKVAPVDADFFKNDACVKLRIKFRFGGHEFPPRVYYKIYLSPLNCVARQLSTTDALYRCDAAREGALRNMGHTKYLTLIMEDACQTLGHKITNERDVVSCKDYMQLCSYVDEMPANHGGRNNPWRRLNQTVLSRASPVYDVFEYLNTQNMSKRVKEMLCRGFCREKLEFQIALTDNSKMCSTPKIMKKTDTFQSSRRKQQSIERAEKMHKLYLTKMHSSFELLPNEREYEDHSTNRSHRQQSEKYGNICIPSITGDDNWEDDAQELYEWTKELSKVTV